MTTFAKIGQRRRNSATTREIQERTWPSLDNARLRQTSPTKISADGEQTDTAPQVLRSGGQSSHRRSGSHYYWIQPLGWLRYRALRRFDFTGPMAGGHHSEYLRTPGNVQEYVASRVYVSGVQGRVAQFVQHSQLRSGSGANVARIVWNHGGQRGSAVDFGSAQQHVWPRSIHAAHLLARGTRRHAAAAR